MLFLKRCWRISLDAFWQFNADDGWAIASHIALSALMSLFPFLLIVTAMAGIFGSANLADEAANLILEAWPAEVAAPIALEIHSVLASAHGQVLTIGTILALYFASSGIESLRIGLNRAYSMIDPRPLWLTRVESIGYVILGAVSMLALSFFVVLAPLIWRAAERRFPAIEPFNDIVTFWRLAIVSMLLITTLVVVHKWLPAGRRRFRDIAPGIIATLALWMIGGMLFGRYLADFAFAYSIYYAGLASTMIALIFLYLTASIFIYGGELNAAIMKAREQRAKAAENTSGSPESA